MTQPHLSYSPTMGVMYFLTDRRHKKGTFSWNKGIMVAPLTARMRPERTGDDVLPVQAISLWFTVKKPSCFEDSQRVFFLLG